MRLIPKQNTWSVKHINDGNLHFSLLMIASARNQVSKARPAVGVIEAVVWGEKAGCLPDVVRWIYRYILVCYQRIRWDSALLWEFYQDWSDCLHNNFSLPDQTFPVESWSHVMTSKHYRMKIWCYSSPQRETDNVGKLRSWFNLDEKTNIWIRWRKKGK